MMTDANQWVIEDKVKNKFLVNRNTFISEEILKLERQRIFDRVWVYVGHESEIPNPHDFVTRKVAGRSIIFTRDQKGKVHVLLNTCTHRGALVCREEKGNSKTFLCCYHAWSFKNDGELIGVPHAEAYGENFDRKTLNMIDARSGSYKGFVFVNFANNAEPLEDYLGGAKEYLDLVADQCADGMEIISGTHKFCIRANWKLLGENSIDGYHIPHNHATYIDFLGEDQQIDVSGGIAGQAFVLGNGHVVKEYKAPWGRPVAKWTPVWGDEAKGEIEEIIKELESRHDAEKVHRMTQNNRNLWIFPNLIINDIMSLTIRTFDPVAPDYMDVTAWAMGPKNEPANLRERRLDNFLSFIGPGGFANPDDIESLEVCQIGFNTYPYVEYQDISRGMGKSQFNIDDEEQMRGFWRKWNELMTAEESKVKVNS